MDRNKWSTQRLLTRLSNLRASHDRMARHTAEYGCDCRDVLEKDSEEKELQEIKSILATREHYPIGAEGRKLRQQAKQNR